MKLYRLFRKKIFLFMFIFQMEKLKGLILPYINQEHFLWITNNNMAKSGKGEYLAPPPRTMRRR